MNAKVSHPPALSIMPQEVDEATLQSLTGTRVIAILRDNFCGVTEQYNYPSKADMMTALGTMASETYTRKIDDQSSEVVARYEIVSLHEVSTKRISQASIMMLLNHPKLDLDNTDQPTTPPAP
jgi:hypothetical protein